MMLKPLAGLAAFVLAGFCAFMPGPASSQPRDIYAVSGVQVNETAANAAAAQQAGFATAQRVGFERLVRRLTAPADLAARSVPVVDAPTMERLVISVDVEEERRSATRYIGRLSVRFDPSGMRTLLRSHGLTVLDSRTAPGLVVAQAGLDTPPETLALWRQVWSQGWLWRRACTACAGPGDAARRAVLGQRRACRARRRRGLCALRDAARAGLGGERERSGSGRRCAPRPRRGLGPNRCAGCGSDASRVGFVGRTNQRPHPERLESCKSPLAAGQRARLSASALYASEPQWERIKQALEGAAQTQISEIRIEAVGREGALVSFSFTGDRAALAAELGRRGVRLEDSAQGPVLRVSGR